MTKIQWTEQTWNPIAGCSIVNSECKNCYAMKLAARLARMGQKKYAGLTHEVNAVWNGQLNFDEKALVAPFGWRKPRRVFVNSMSDLFHEKLNDARIDLVFAVMGLCPQHTFQVLTKRPARMLKYLATPGRETMINAAAWSMLPQSSFKKENWPPLWPLRNVWLGTSIGAQASRGNLDILRTIPAAIRFVSYEPALEAVNFQFPEVGNAGIDWLIIGGESGDGARPFHLDWARDVIFQCKRAGVAVFVKQLGRNPIDSVEVNTMSVEQVPIKLKDKHGGNWDEWPEELRMREYPGGLFNGAVVAGVCRLCGGGQSTQPNERPFSFWFDASRTLCIKCAESFAPVRMPVLK